MAHHRSIVAVHRKGSIVVGQLYFKTATHVVLLNNVSGDADLGRFRMFRQRHLEPEVDVIIIPRTDIVGIAALEIRLDYFHSSDRKFDMDNVAKCVIDAMNAVAYTDDQLADLQSSKAHDLRRRLTLSGGPADLIKPLI